MNLQDCSLWISDIDEVLLGLPELKELEGKRVLVTGATGLICSAVVDVLIRWNITHDGKIGILAAGRSEKKIVERFSPFDKEAWFEYLSYDATSSNRICL